jgi:HEAT repeat protein
MDFFSRKVKTVFFILCIGCTFGLYAQENQETDIVKSRIEQLATCKEESGPQLLDSLGKEKDKVWPLLLANLQHENARVRLSVVYLLGQNADKKQEILPVLVKRLEQEKESIVLRQIIAVLARLGDQETFAPLYELLQHSDLLVRLDALRALTLLPETKAAVKLAEHLKKEKVPEMQGAILQALSVLRDETAISAALATVPVGEMSTRKAAFLTALAECAATLNNPQSHLLLAQIATEAAEVKARAYALRLLMPMLRSSDVGLISHTLEDRDLDMRREAYRKFVELTVRSLGYSPEAAVVERAIGVARWNKWSDVEYLAAELLHQPSPKLESDLIAHGDLAVATLLEVYPQANEGVRSSILNIVREISWQRLLRLYQDNKGNAELQKILAAGNTQEWWVLQLASCESKDKIVADESLGIVSLKDTVVFLAKVAGDKKAVMFVMSDYLLALKEAAAWDILLAQFTTLSSGQKVALLGQLDMARYAGSEKLLPYIEKEEDQVRILLCKLFANQKLQSAKPVLLNMLAQELPIDVQKAVSESLKKMESLTAGDVKTALQKEKRNDSQLFLLAMLCQLEKLEEVLKLAAAEQNPTLKEAWLRELAKATGWSSEHLPLLSELIAKENDGARKSLAIQLLGKFAYDGAAPAIIKIVKDEKEVAAKQQALNQLLLFNKPEVAQAIEGFFKDAQDAAWLAELREALAKVSPAKALPLIEQAVSQSLFDIKSLTLLFKLNPVRAIELIEANFGKLRDDKEKLTVLQTVRAAWQGNHVAWLLQQFASHGGEVRQELASVLDSITGVKSGYRADLSEDEQKKISLPWQVWEQEQTLITGLVHGLLAAKPGVEQDKARQELLVYKEKAVSALAKILPEQKSVEGKQLIIATLGMSGVESAASLVRPMLREIHDLRSAAYVALSRLNAGKVALELPIWYVGESEPLARLVLIDLMWQHKVAFASDGWQEYLATGDDKVAAALVQLLKKYPLAEKKAVLLSRLPQMNDTVRSEIVELLKGQLQVADLPAVAAAFTAVQNDKITATMLPLLAQFTDIPGDKAKDGKAFLAWWNDKNSVREHAEADRLITTLLTSSDAESVMAGKELEKVSGEMRKFVQEKIALLLAQPETTVTARERILGLLGSYRDAGYLPLFTNQLVSEQPSVRRLAARGLYLLGYTVAGKTMQEIVKHQDASVRFFAIKGMSESGDKSVLPVLVAALADSDVRVREEALSGALQFGFTDAQMLQSLVKDQGPAVRVMAIQRSAELKQAGMIEQFIAYLSDPFPTVRRAAGDALRSLTGQNIVYAAEESKENRSAAILQWQGWLSRQKSLQEMKILAARFTEEGIKVEEVRGRINEKYNQLPSDAKEEAKGVLLSFLDSPQNVVRLEMVQALAAMNDRSLAPALADKLKDSDILVRQAALQAVQKLSSDKVELALSEEAEKQWPQEVKKLEAWWPEKIKSRSDVQAWQKKLDELYQNLGKEKREVLVSQLCEIATQAPELVKAGLKDSRREVAVLVAQALCQLKALDSVADMLPLLSDAQNRAMLRQAIEEMVATKLPMLSEETVSKEAYFSKLIVWWQECEREESKNIAAAVAKGLQEVSASPEKFKEVAQNITALGQAVRPLLEEHLADTRPAVRNTVVFALGNLNDRRSIPQLLAVMHDGDFAARQVVRAAIYSVSRKRLSEVPEPQNDKEWEAEYLRIGQWWKEWESLYPGELKKTWEEVAPLITDAARQEKVVQTLAAEGTASYALCSDLLKADKREVRLGALAVLKGLKFIGVVPTLLPFISDTDAEVQKGVAETLTLLTGKAVPQLDTNEAIWQKEIERLQGWWQQYQKGVPAIDNASLQNILLALADNKMSRDEGKKSLNRLGLGVAGALEKYFKNQQDTLRLGAVRAYATLALSGNEKMWQELLLDANLKVRQESVLALQILAGDKEKLPFSFDDKVEVEWQKKLSEWLPAWKERQHKAAREAALVQLDKDSQPLSKATDIGNRNELDAARNVSQYLKSPYKDVAAKAWDVLRNVAKGQFSFRLEGTLQEQQDDFKEILQRFAEKAKKIEEDEKNIEEKLHNLDKDWLAAGAPVGLVSLEHCDKLRDLLSEMTYDSNSHPLLQNKYLEVLQKNECAPADYYVAADRKSREDKLYIVNGAIYERQIALKRAAEDGRKLEETLGDLFATSSIIADKDIKAVRRLIDLLSHDWIGLRSKAIQTLNRLVGDSKGYRADVSKTLNQKAVEAWQQWVGEEEMQLNQRRNTQLEKVKAVLAELGKITHIDSNETLGKVSKVVAALSESDAAVREQALTVLKNLNNGETFGYKSEAAADTQMESFNKWNQWFVKEAKQLGETQALIQLSSRVVGYGKVQTAEQVAELATLKESLAATQPQARQLAFTTLRDYARRYAAELNDFSYDPQATENVRAESKKLWDAWFTAKIAPITDAEKARRQQVQEFIAKFPQGKVTSQAEWEIAGKLVELLADVASPVREDALAALQKLAAGETYGFVPGLSPGMQKHVLGYWQWWLKLQQRSLGGKK